MNTRYFCEKCDQVYPESWMPYTCPFCQGTFSILLDDKLEKSDFLSQLPGIWRFRRTFGLPSNAPVSYLGEGNTPLIKRSINGKQVYLKMESQNPTLSYKDRGTTVLTSMLRSNGIKEVVEDSSGNAGASLAAYCAAFKIDCEIFVPDNTSGPKLAQIDAAGAKITRIAGPRNITTEAILTYVENNHITYASHAFQPFGLAGIATLAYEIYEQLGSIPDRVIAPIGHGSLFLGIVLGFEMLLKSGMVVKMPELIGVQAENYSSLYHKWIGKIEDLNFLPTIAEGVRIKEPIRGEEILSKLIQYDGRIIAISEEDLTQAWKELGQNGIFVEPTSALVWAVSKQISNKIDTVTVLIITGHGLKSYH